MTLTAAQQELRDGRLTASRIACLMSGDEAKILNLWHEMVGSAEFVAEDLDHYWPAVLGSFTEPLSLDWYEYKSGKPVTRRGEVVICPYADWAAATLDGWDDTIPAPIECKHCGGYERRDIVIARYQPQAHWQMLVTGTTQVVFSVIEGAKEPVIEVVSWDEAYGDELWRRAERFMEHVWNLTPPVEMAPVEAPVIPVKTLDMSGSNSWAAQAAVWLKHRDAAKEYASAEEEIKKIVPKDVARAYGSGIILKRNKRGSATIEELKDG